MMMVSSKRRPLLVLVAGLVLIVGLVVAGLLLFGNNDDGDSVGDVVKEKIPTASRSGSVGGADNVTRLSPAEASFNLDELPAKYDYEVDVSNTFAMNLSTFASDPMWFPTGEEGEAKAKEWGIINGFQVYYQPRGLFSATLQGAPYITVSTYQFEDVGGARKAYAYLNNALKNSPGSEAVEARPLANDSSAYRVIQGTVGPSETVAVFHRYTFRRGNTIVSVQTWGGDDYMNIDPARNIAAEIDNKLLGSRPAVEPTPLPTPSFSGAGN